MVGQPGNRPRHGFALSRKKGIEFDRAQFCRDRVVALGCDTLAHHDLHPAVFDKKFFVAAENPSCFAEQFDLLFKAVGDRQSCAVPPKWGVAPLGDLIMQNQKIADLVHVGKLLVIELGNITRAHRAAGQHPYQAQHRALDQVDRCGFERLHKTA